MPNLHKTLYIVTQENVRSQAAIRMAIVCSGMGIHSVLSNTHSFFRLASIVETDIDPYRLPDPADYGIFHVLDTPCPIHALGISDWLVSAIMEWTGVEEFPFHTIKPETWFTSARSAFESLPDEYKTEGANLILTEILNSIESSDGQHRLEIVTEALRKKGEALMMGYTKDNCHEISTNHETKKVH